MDRHAGRNDAGASSARMAGADAAEFAEYVRSERERRTSGSSPDLAALEEGDGRNWPGGMYRRAMMRAYAESIGVDREAALEDCEQPAAAPVQVDVLEPAPPPIVAPEREWRLAMRVWRPSRRQAVGAGAMVLTLAAVGLLWTGIEALTAPRPVSIVATASQPSNSSVAATAPPQVQAATPTPKPIAQPTVASAPAAAAAPVAHRTPPIVAASRSTGVAGDGRLTVTSEPAGARVTVNGIGWGNTPLTIRHLPPGEKRVRVTMPNYLSEEHVVRLGAADTAVRIRLRARPTPRATQSPSSRTARDAAGRLTSR